MIKKIIKVAAIVLLSLFGLAFAAPLIFKGKITRFIKKEINQHVLAQVDFTRVDLSLFRSFPKLSIALDSFRMTGKGEFSADTLIAAKKIEIAVNVFGLISGNEINIRSVLIDQPRIHAIVHKNGHANWDITKKESPDIASSTSSPYRLALKKYAITNGYISYRDETNNSGTELIGFNHSGKGDFSADNFILETKTAVEAIQFSYGSIAYLNHTRLKADADFKVDNTAAKYSFKTGEIMLNELKIKTEGWFQIVNDSSYSMNISFNTPSNDFKSILSLVPSIYKRDFAEIKTSGEATCSGTIRGRYDTRHLPAYHVKLDVKNGFFQYPDLPKPVQHINLSMVIDNPDGITDHTVINIPQAHLEMDALPIDARFTLKTPVSDPYIDAEAKGRLDLARVTQLVKLENGTHLTGILDAEVNARGNLSAIEKKRWEKFNANGNFSLSDFLYASNAYPDGIRLSSLVMSLSPKNITVSQLIGEYLKTRFSAEGSINNMMAYLFKNEALNGALHVKADQVNLNEWMGTASADSNSKSNQAKVLTPFLVPVRN